MQKKLTDISIRALPQGTYFDERTPAFGIRIGKNRKTWIVLKGPRTRRVQTILGYYPALTLSDARKKAHVALGSPLDPPRAPSFPQAIQEFLAEGEWKPRTRKVMKSSLKHFTFTKTLEKITHDDIDEVLDRIEGPSARAHALKDIRAFFNWCVPGYLQSSPVVGFKMPSYIPRKKTLTDDELKRVWRATEDMGVYGVQVRCLITTGQRVSQILNFDPKWIQDDAILFPASVMKSGVDHTIPLGKLTASLLPKLQLTTYQGKPKRKLDEKSGVLGWTLHDIRRVFSSGMASVGVPQHVTERLIDHTTDSHVSDVAAIYNLYNYLPEMRQAIDAWENRLQAIVRS